MLRFFFATILISTLFLFQSCQVQSEGKKEINFNQIDELDSLFVQEFTSNLIRYVGRKPEDASNENKFHAYFDEHYNQQINQHDLTHYHAKGEKEFFVFTRIAPSLKLKKVAICGWVKRESNGKVVELEEIFRTWKFEPELLSEKSDFLFAKVIGGEPTEPYQTNNSGNTDFIEFPSDVVYYNKDAKQWTSTQEDVLAEFIDLKIERTKERILAFEEEQKKANNDTLK